MIIYVLIYLVILNSQCVHSKVININSINDTNSSECCACVHGTCVCSSLYTALINITNNTIINITSKSVALNDSTKMGSGNLTNITITGSNVTIMCNNSGSVYCESCDNVKIEGITWDSCGNLNGPNIAGVTFNVGSNILLVSCTFQNSQITAIGFLEVSGNINVSRCNFLSNKGKGDSGGLSFSSGSIFVNLSISDNYFYNNGDYFGQTLTISDSAGLATWYVTITKTIFFSNLQGSAFFIIKGNSSFQFDELAFINNLVGFSSIAGIQFQLIGNSSLSLSNSLFTHNLGGALWWLIQGGDEAEIFISNSTFKNSSSQLKLKYEVSTILLMCVGRAVQITLVDVEISESISGTIDGDGSASLFIAFLDAHDDYV